MAASLSLSPALLARDTAAVRERVEAMGARLERVGTIPDVRRKVGLDAVLGLVPIVGDLVAAALGRYLIWEARNLGMSRFQIARMAANIGVDTVLGAVPLVGDDFDLLYRSSTRNLCILIRHLDRHHPGSVVVEQ